MATWKKVLVSGSSAEVSQLNVGANQQITTAQSTTFLTGSFTGSFKGDGSGLSGLTSGTVISVTAGTGLTGGTITSTGTIAIDSTVATLTGTQTLTNKTLTAPIISSISNTGTLTLPSATDTLVGRATTDTLTNKTLTAPVIGTAGATFSGSTSGTTVVAASAVAGTTTLTLPSATDTLVGKATADTLTNKTFNTAGTGNLFQIAGNNITGVTGTGNTVVLATSPTLVTPVLGTVAAGSILTNATGLPISTGVSGLGTGVATFLATPSSTNLAAAVTGETGTGNLVFSADPSFTGTTNVAALAATGNVTIAGNLNVSGLISGSATYITSTNVAITDQFILLASGSGATVDAGIIVQDAAGDGEAFYWENNVTGTGRWAIASSVNPTSVTVTAAEYMVSARTAAGAPSGNPTFGGGTNGFGQIYVNSSNQDIYIYA